MRPIITTTMPPRPDPGSFRDHGSTIFLAGDTVYRALDGQAASEYEAVRQTGILDTLVKDGWIVATETANPGDAGIDAALLLSHKRIPYISYPYEWPFALLRQAAIFHLDLHLLLLENSITLSDATAYNVQFVGTKPCFIDIPSLKHYKEGEYWLGHRQFCEQFLNPLLLQAYLGVPHNALFRGNLEGVRMEDMVRLAPWRALLDWRYLIHVWMPDRLQTRAEQHREKTAKTLDKHPLKRSALVGMLKQLRGWIAGLSLQNRGATTWSHYTETHSYQDHEMKAKRAFVARFAERFRPAKLIDLGCNLGLFVEVALAHGAGYAVGFDADYPILNLAYERAREKGLPFLPLYQDLANPSPEQGWYQAERGGFFRRTRADALLALALVHHLAIGRNVPLQRVLDMLMELAPCGVVEFVPKQDPMVQSMLQLREDIFTEYTQENFDNLLNRRAEIVERETISASGRTLYLYVAHPPHRPAH